MQPTNPSDHDTSETPVASEQSSADSITAQRGPIDWKRFVGPRFLAWVENVEHPRIVASFAALFFLAIAYLVLDIAFGKKDDWQYGLPSMVEVAKIMWIELGPTVTTIIGLIVLALVMTLVFYVYVILRATYEYLVHRTSDEYLDRQYVKLARKRFLLLLPAHIITALIVLAFVHLWAFWTFGYARAETYIEVLRAVLMFSLPYLLPLMLIVSVSELIWGTLRKPRLDDGLPQPERMGRPVLQAGIINTILLLTFTAPWILTLVHEMRGLSEVFAEVLPGAPLYVRPSEEPLVTETNPYLTPSDKIVLGYRDAIMTGRIPLPSDISVPFVFAEHDLAGRQGTACKGSLCPAFSTAVIADPFSGAYEYWAAVDLLAAVERQERKPLNLVVLIDISGSMHGSYDQYYVDSFGNRREIPSWYEERERRKIESVRETVAVLTKLLEPDDRLGIIVFDDAVRLAKPLNLNADTDLKAIRSHIEALEPRRGQSNLHDALNDAIELLRAFANDTSYESRMLVFTDARSKDGDFAIGPLVSSLHSAAWNGIYTTYVSVGEQMPHELYEGIRGMRGGAAYIVRSSREMLELLPTYFASMHAPLLLDIGLESAGVNGVPVQYYGIAHEVTGPGAIELPRSMFAPAGDREHPHHTLLLGFGAHTGSHEADVTMRWTDRDGDEEQMTIPLRFATGTPTSDAAPVHTAVAVEQYATFLRAWVSTVHPEFVGPMSCVPERFFYESEATQAPSEESDRVIVQVAEPTPRVPSCFDTAIWERGDHGLVIPPSHLYRLATLKGYLKEQAALPGGDTVRGVFPIMDALERAPRQLE